jgi:predicted nucleic acid-binding protein
MFNSYLIDSNILIGFLNGDKNIAKWILDRKKDKDSLYISFITSIELLSLKSLKDSDVDKILDFISNFNEINATSDIVKLSATLRRKNLLKLGDAIITATAIYRKSILVTNDKILAKKVSKFIEVISI